MIRKLSFLSSPNLAITRALVRMGSPRFHSEGFSWRWIKSMFVSYSYMTLLLGLLGVIGATLLTLIRLGVEEYFPSWLQPSATWWEASYHMIFWIVGFSLLWISLVTINHWTDLVSEIVPKLESLQFSWTGVFGGIGAFWGYISVVVGDMWKEFILTIYSDPRNIFNTKVAQELVLFKTTVGAGLQFGMTYLIAKLSFLVGPDSLIVSGINSLTASVGNSLNYILTSVGSGVAWCWYESVGYVQRLITPNVPSFFTPAANAVTNRVATGIVLSIVLWILRLFLGFPF